VARRALPSTSRRSHVEIGGCTPFTPKEKFFTFRGFSPTVEHEKQLIAGAGGEGVQFEQQGGPPGGPNHQGGPQGPGGYQQFQQPYPGQPSPGGPMEASLVGEVAPPMASPGPISSRHHNSPQETPPKLRLMRMQPRGPLTTPTTTSPGPSPGQRPNHKHSPSDSAPAATAAAVGGGAGTGQADYSAPWVEYYRSLGMHRLVPPPKPQEGCPCRGSTAPGGRAPVAGFLRVRTQAPPPSSSTPQPYPGYGYAAYGAQQGQQPAPYQAHPQWTDSSSSSDGPRIASQYECPRLFLLIITLCFRKNHQNRTEVLFHAPLFRPALSTLRVPTLLIKHWTVPKFENAL
ncbi:hypothetical protein JTE90_002219, partial [Oedothorax gibbosus]